jgi:conjugal transfer mating pair stabilization protein TraN
MRRLFRPVIYPLIVCLLHNPFAALYFASALILFQPFPAIADVFLDKAAEGQDFGTAIRDEFRVPSVNKDTGTITLQNGLVDGQKIKQNELFQEIQPGSIDDALSSYGDNEALNAYTNAFLDNLQDNETQHANSY